MERVTDDQFALMEGKICHVPGGVDEYLKNIDSSRHVKDGPKAASSAKTYAMGENYADEKSEDTEGSSRHVLTNQERRELKKRFDSVERRLKKAEIVPDQVRTQMASADQSDAETLMRLQKELEDAKAAVSELENEWLELSERLG